MKKGIVLGIVFLLVVMSFTSISGNQLNYQIINSSGKGNTLYVGGSGEGNYTKIQDAIDNASDGDTVFVLDDSSPYIENIVVDKSINLECEYRAEIYGREYAAVIKISADWVKISGFATIRSEVSYIGIEVCSDYNTITGNYIEFNTYNIILNYSNGNIISNNFIRCSPNLGIFVSSSNCNIITNNIITGNVQGIDLEDSSYNNIIKNNFVDNKIDATFIKSFSNHWKQNYWNRPRMFPKLIFGVLIIGPIWMPWFNIDWNPAKEPYNYTTTHGCGIE